MEATCSFCGQATTLPKDILALRARKNTPGGAPSNNGVVLMVAGAAVALLALTGVAIALMKNEPHETPPVIQPPTPVPAATSAVPSTPKVPSLTDRRANGEARANEILRRLNANGCKEVILAPTQSAGEQTVETKFVMNGTCVTVIAVTGVEKNALTLKMKSPLGDVIPTPPPAPEVEFSICPKMRGPHPTTIVPTTEDPYTVAAIECPAPGKKKP
ncbi:hypothetical protein AKJ09_03704 [Labilithrix luteola]|uniref:Uncharacterized protein n=1 Tax=Labilithrix luteola TaxID=1391654 RepID=A0A0K1PU29_9BACT|nr:hypothetical protein AKJ09_03704 [Labilithrix luteola]